MEPIGDWGEYTKEEIMSLTAGHDILELKIKGDVPSTIEEFAPLVTELCIKGIEDRRSLD